MASLNEGESNILRTALRIWHKSQPFERAVSEAIRKSGGDYEDYLRIVSKLRDYARKHRIPLNEAARRML